MSTIPTPDEAREILARIAQRIADGDEQLMKQIRQLADSGWQSGSMGTDDLPDGVDGNHVGGRRQACAHCGADVAIIGGRYASHTRPEGDQCRDSGRPALS